LSCLGLTVKQDLWSMDSDGTSVDRGDLSPVMTTSECFRETKEETFV
jgi:hypothetical protein